MTKHSHTLAPDLKRGSRTLQEMREELDTGRTTAVALTRLALDEAERSRVALNAYSVIATETALEAAAASDRRYSNGTARLLEGLPIAVKDIIDTENIETRYGSAAYIGHRPSHDADIVRVLKDKGAIIIGKTTTHEFAWGVTTSSPRFGDTLNPHDPNCIPGGSSGGTAAAIGFGAIAAGLGTDTGGSARIPASLCGVVGFKPTYSRLSTNGIFPLAPTLDHPGILGKTVGDVTLLAEALGLTSGFEPTLHGQIGVIDKIANVPVEECVAVAFDHSIELLSANLEIERIESCPLFDDKFRVFAGIVLMEGGITHFSRNSLELMASSYNHETMTRLELAKTSTVGEYAQNLQTRWNFITDLHQLMKRFRFLITPTTPCVAPKRGIDMISIGGWSGTVREAMMTYTSPFNIAGFPAISIPMPILGSGLPTGLQIVGRRDEDDALIALARNIEAILSRGPSETQSVEVLTEIPPAP